MARCCRFPCISVLCMLVSLQWYVCPFCRGCIRVFDTLANVHMMPSGSLVTAYTCGRMPLHSRIGSLYSGSRFILELPDSAQAFSLKPPGYWRENYALQPSLTLMLGYHTWSTLAAEQRWVMWSSLQLASKRDYKHRWLRSMLYIAAPRSDLAWHKKLQKLIHFKASLIILL
jgi:hypothetical protein